MATHHLLSGCLVLHLYMQGIFHLKSTSGTLKRINIADKDSYLMINDTSWLMKAPAMAAHTNTDALTFIAYQKENQSQTLMSFEYSNTLIPTANCSGNNAKKSGYLRKTAWYFFWIIHYALPLMTFLVGRTSIHLLDDEREGGSERKTQTGQTGSAKKSSKACDSEIATPCCSVDEGIRDTSIGSKSQCLSVAHIYTTESSTSKLETESVDVFCKDHTQENTEHSIEKESYPDLGKSKREYTDLRISQTAEEKVLCKESIKENGSGVIRDKSDKSMQVIHKKDNDMEPQEKKSGETEDAEEVLRNGTIEPLPISCMKRPEVPKDKDQTFKDSQDLFISSANISCSESQHDKTDDGTSDKSVLQSNTSGKKKKLRISLSSTSREMNNSQMCVRQTKNEETIHLEKESSAENCSDSISYDESVRVNSEPQLSTLESQESIFKAVDSSNSSRDILCGQGINAGVEEARQLSESKAQQPTSSANEKPENMPTSIVDNTSDSNFDSCRRDGKSSLVTQFVTISPTSKRDFNAKKIGGDTNCVDTIAVAPKRHTIPQEDSITTGELGESFRFCHRCKSFLNTTNQTGPVQATVDVSVKSLSCYDGDAKSSEETPLSLVSDSNKIKSELELLGKALGANQIVSCDTHTSSHEIEEPIAPNNTCIFIPCMKTIKCSKSYQNITTNYKRVISVSKIRPGGLYGFGSHQHVGCSSFSNLRRVGSLQSITGNSKLRIELEKETEVKLFEDGTTSYVDLWRIYEDENGLDEIDLSIFGNAKVYLSQEGLDVIEKLTRYAVEEGFRRANASEVD